MIAEGEEALATAVLQVLSDLALARCLSTAGRRYVEAYHNWEAGARRLVGVYERARSETGRQNA
ncbi:MAG: hypothetical protein GWN58_62050 [Anaerolineae bacterium]|nr:hypothetical protein [Anaerolineae bacterium]